MKNYHKLGMIRPVKIYDALIYLKKHHPEYKDINVTEMSEWIQQFLGEDDESLPESSNTKATDTLNDSSSSTSEKLLDGILFSVDGGGMWGGRVWTISNHAAAAHNFTPMFGRTDVAHVAAPPDAL